jgi:hypothetical protein
MYNTARWTDQQARYLEVWERELPVWQVYEKSTLPVCPSKTYATLV